MTNSTRSNSELKISNRQRKVVGCFFTYFKLYFMVSKNKLSLNMKKNLDGMIPFLIFAAAK